MERHMSHVRANVQRCHRGEEIHLECLALGSQVACLLKQVRNSPLPVLATPAVSPSLVLSTTSRCPQLAAAPTGSQSPVYVYRQAPVSERQMRTTPRSPAVAKKCALPASPCCIREGTGSTPGKAEPMGRTARPVWGVKV